MQHQRRTICLALCIYIYTSLPARLLLLNSNGRFGYFGAIAIAPGTSLQQLMKQLTPSSRESFDAIILYTRKSVINVKVFAAAMKIASF